MSDLIAELYALAKRMAAAGETDEPTIAALAAEEIERLQAEIEQLRKENHEPVIHRSSCPNCQHDDPGMNDDWIEDGKAYRSMYCETCGADWVERFSLKFEGIQDLSTENE